MKPEFIGVVENGKLPRPVSEQIATLIRQAEGKRVGISIREVKRRRSNNQNAYYWGVIVPAVQAMFEDAGNTVDGEVVHDFLKREVGGLKQVVVDPSGIRRTVVRSSASLTTLEMETYLEKVRAWAAQFGTVISLPNEFN